MAYPANVLPVMIASPSDVPEERAIAREVLHEWNYVHSSAASAVLMPVGWETHSAPDLGDRAQSLINTRVLDDCDVLIGVFWTKIGTPTGVAPSGSIEEIQRHINSGKLAMVYFADKPVVPGSFNADQYATLLEFKEWCKGKGLFGVFSEKEEFRTKLRNDLQTNLYKNPYVQSLMQLGRRSIGVQEARSQPIVENIGQRLSEEAKTLLQEAATSESGSILRRKWLQGDSYMTNGKSFGDMESAREKAAWANGLRQLTSAGMIEPTGPEGIYNVTDLGFRVADQLKNHPQMEVLI